MVICVDVRYVRISWEWDWEIIGYTVIGRFKSSKVIGSYWIYKRKKLKGNRL